VLAGAGSAGAVLLCGASGAAAQAPPVPTLNWEPCGSAPNVQCTTALVPRRYDRRTDARLKLFLAKSPATDPEHRIGSLFINFGGPGATAADIFEILGSELFPGLNERFDIIAMDPRGVGQSEPSIDCRVNQETEGIYSQPFTTPFNLDRSALVRKDRSYIEKCLERNQDILPYVTTGNAARDMNLLRRALHEPKIDYVGFSYGTLLGATFARLFPARYRSMVLDGPVDATTYMNDPMQYLAEQSAGFERALGRFFQACAADQVACSGFGGSDPWAAFDELVEQANANPIPATEFADDPRPVDGNDILVAAAQVMYVKQWWGLLGAALADAAAGDGAGIREFADIFYGRNPDGTYDPITDRYFTLSALEQRYPRDVDTYIEAGDRSWGMFEHAWWNSGYVELNWGLYPVKPVGAYYGPFRLPASAPTPLVVATRYDPATTYRGALRLVRDLRNARLLTMIGDGHTAYGGNSACIDEAVEAYVNTLTLPAPGTTCRQDVPFEAPGPLAEAVGAAGQAKGVPVRPHTKVLLP